MPGTQITIVGNAGSEPELRYTPTGSGVANFSVAVTPRHFDKTSNTWSDGDTTWYRVNAWNQLAENVAESIRKGDRVIVLGSLENREWEDADGNTRHTLEVRADAIGPDLMFASARVTKSARSKAEEAPAEPTPIRPAAAKSGRAPAASRSRR